MITKKIKLCLVDDDKLIVDLLGDYLNSILEFNVITTYYSGNSFLSHLNNSNLPDILLLDLQMKNGKGQDVVAEIVKQGLDIKLIVLSSFYRPNYLGFMFQLGVHAFIPKEIEKNKLVHVIKNVYKSGHYFDQDQMNILRKQISSKSSEIKINNKNKLTPREIDVLKLVCHQFTAQEIADKLFISKNTVDTHKANLLSKTGAKNIAGLIIFASQNRLINIDELMI